MNKKSLLEKKKRSPLINLGMSSRRRPLLSTKGQTGGFNAGQAADIQAQQQAAGNSETFSA